MKNNTKKPTLSSEIRTLEKAARRHDMTLSFMAGVLFSIGVGMLVVAIVYQYW